MLIGEYVQQFESGINEATNTANAAAAQANSAYNRATDALNTANGVAANVSRSLIDLNAAGDGSTVTLNAPRNTGNPATAPLPVADATKAGVMNSATYVNLQNLNTRVGSLEKQTTTYIVSFTSDTPTQDEINNAYKTAYPTAPFPPIDGTTVIDSTRQLYYRWVKNGAIWIKTAGFVVSQFTNETLGTIKGSTTAGQIQAETDGTGSLVGYDQIKNDIATNATGIATLTENLATTNSDIATLRTTVNSNTSKANLAINTINSSADASNAKVGYIRNNGIQETINLPIVSASQAGVVTPTMFNSWNQDGDSLYQNYLLNTGNIRTSKITNIVDSAGTVIISLNAFQSTVNEVQLYAINSGVRIYDVGLQQQKNIPLYNPMLTLPKRDGDFHTLGEFIIVNNDKIYPLIIEFNISNPSLLYELKVWCTKYTPVIQSNEIS